MSSIANPGSAAFEAFEADGWEQQAAGYDAFFRTITTSTAEAVLDAARVGAGTRVLDVGTGPGYLAGRAAGRGADATGIDIAPRMIAIARSGWPKARFQQADAHALPFADGSFDAVTANFALLHLGRPDQAIREVFRVLERGGRAALTVWDQPPRMPLLSVVADALEAAGARPPDDIPAGPPIFHYADDERFGALLRQAGLVDVTVVTLEFTYRARDAEEVWSGLMGGTVRTSALVVRQPVETQHRVHTAFVDIVETYRRGTSIELPISVKLGTGIRPAPPGGDGRKDGLVQSWRERGVAEVGQDRGDQGAARRS